MKKLLSISSLAFSMLLSSQTSFADQTASSGTVGAFVVNGTPVKIGSAVSSSMVRLTFGGWSCSGITISPRHVLTAGHCVSGKPAVKNIRTYFGASKTPGPGAIRYRLHPKYGSEGNFLRADLAVIRLAGAAPGGVRPALLSKTAIASGARLILTGYGYSDSARTQSGRLLQSDFFFGRTAGLLASRLSDGTRLLTFSGPKPSCQGDSGGATFEPTPAGLKIVGVHSMSNCVNRATDVYAPDHVAWIRSMLSL